MNRLFSNADDEDELQFGETFTPILRVLLDFSIISTTIIRTLKYPTHSKSRCIFFSLCYNINRTWGVSSVGRAIGSQSIGQEFESPTLHHFLFIQTSEKVDLWSESPKGDFLLILQEYLQPKLFHCASI